MASSGVSTWNPNTLQIITGAARLLSAIQTGETLPEDEYQDALDALNGIIHAWQASGILIWTQETVTVPLVAGQPSYQIGTGAPDVNTPRPVKVTNARIKVVSTGAETPLIPMSRLDYANLTGKTSPPGPVQQWFYDAQIPYGTLSVYPAPADALSQVLLTAQRPLQDFVTQADTADVPQEWISALRFALAAELAAEYDCPAARFQIIKAMADEKLAIVKAWDTEEPQTTTYPFSQTVYQLIARALRLCEACGPQDMPTLGQVNNGFTSLNALVQAWQASGAHVWAQETISITLAVGQASYQIGVGAPDVNQTRPLRVSDSRLVTTATGVEEPMIPMSRLDYANISGKTSPTGQPSQWFYDPQLPNGIFSVYPAPADTSSTIEIVAQRQLVPFATLSSSADFPPEWADALVFNLAVSLGPEYRLDPAKLAAIKTLADEKFTMAQRWDTEAQGTTTYPFSQTVYQLIAGALRLCGGSGPQDMPTLGQVNNAFASLNALVQGWQALGMHVWTQETISVPLVIGKATYTIGTGGDVSQGRPLRITAARQVITASDEVVPMIPMTRWDYGNLSGKTSPTGQPEQWFYDPQIPLGILSLYPAPIDTASTVEVIAQRQLTTFADLSATADFPVEWLDALRFNLACAVALEYNCPPERFGSLKLLAKEKLDVAQAWDVEQQGTSTLPFSQGIYQLIAGALRLCGAVGPQDVPTLGLVNNAFYALNAMVQAWQASGIHVWAEIDCTLFLQPAQITYQLGAASPDHATLSNAWVQPASTALAAGGATSIALSSISGVVAGNQIGIWLDSGTVFWTTVSGAPGGDVVTLADALPSQAASGAQVVSYATALTRPLRVPGARRYQFAAPGGQPIEIPIIPMSRLDYGMVPNKTTPGTVTQFFFDPQLNLALMNVWPAPSNAQSAVKFTAQRPLNTFTTLSDVADFPAEWNAALRFNLAVEMWPEHHFRGAKSPNDSLGPLARAQDFQAFQALAQQKLMVAQAWDREPESVRFGMATFPAARN